MATSVSVVVPTFNRLGGLTRALRGLQEQVSAPEFEVVVVSDGSTDGTNEFLQRANDFSFPLVPIVQDNSGPAGARNAGVQAASGTWLLFLDDDVNPSPNLLRSHLERHDAENGPTVVIGPMLTPEEHEMSPWVRWEQLMLYKQYEAMEAGLWQPKARQFYTGNASVERRFVLEAGGFNASFRRAEDVELAYRLEDLGLGFAYEPRARAFHYAERSFESWLAIADAYGRNDIKFATEHGRDWILDRTLEEFESRHALTRGLVTLVLPYPEVAKRVTDGLHAVLNLSMRAELDQVTRYALSAIYQLAFYQGVAAELGTERFLSLLRQRAQQRSKTA